MIRSLKYGKVATVPGVPVTGWADSIFEKMTNNRKQMLQMKVNLEKNEINFIKMSCFEKTLGKIILICRNYSF
ncbi:MAG: hypothetical protein ABI366_08360 [Ginsengibacter sp.]